MHESEVEPRSTAQPEISNDCRTVPGVGASMVSLTSERRNAVTKPAVSGDAGGAGSYASEVVGKSGALVLPLTQTAAPPRSVSTRPTGRSNSASDASDP